MVANTRAIATTIVILGVVVPFIFGYSSAPYSSATSDGGERHESDNYFGRCKLVTLRQEVFGRVNVYAFLDDTSHYSYRQAIMLRMLKERLERSGFTDVLYFIVAAPADLPRDEAEENAEREAWRDVAAIEQPTRRRRRRLDAAESPGNFHFGLIQDTHELGVWARFHASKDQIAVTDRCGRLTYQIIVPWSILYFPYVKAAILSTYNENPCGPCNETAATTDFQGDEQAARMHQARHQELAVSPSGSGLQWESSTLTSDSSSENKREVVVTASASSSSSSPSPSPARETTDKGERSLPAGRTNGCADDDGNLTEPSKRRFTEDTSEGNNNDVLPPSVPIRIIMRAPHVHRSNHTLMKKHWYLILKTEHPDYHGHLNSEEEEEEEEEEETIPHDTRNQELVGSGTESTGGESIAYDKDEAPGTFGEVADYWRTYEDNGEHDTYPSDSTVSNVVDYSHTKIGNEKIYAEPPIAAMAFPTKDARLETTEATDGDHGCAGKTAAPPTTEDSRFVETNDRKLGDDADKDSRQKFIAHYSRLLPWIYYVLAE